MPTPASKGRTRRSARKTVSSAGVLDKLAGMSSAAVKAKTGKTWTEWGRTLDAAGAKKMAHAAIAKLLHEVHGVGDWWAQMVTVGYERLRGLRTRHQKSDGKFSASASRTVGVGIASLYQAWADEERRAGWLSDKKLTLRGAQLNKSVRFNHGAVSAAVVVMFYAKGAEKSMVTVEHNKLSSTAEVQRWKAEWKKRLDRMMGVLG